MTNASGRSVYASQEGHQILLLGDPGRVEGQALDWELRYCGTDESSVKAVIHVGVPEPEGGEVDAAAHGRPVATVLTEADLERVMLADRKMSSQTLLGLVAEGRIVTSSRDAFRTLAGLLMRRAGRAHLVDHRAFGLWLQAWTEFETASVRVVLNRRTGFGIEDDVAVSGLLVARDRIEDVTGFERNLVAWIPAPQERRDADASVDARQLAWHLTVMADESRTSMVITDRVETVVYLARSSVVKCDLGVLVPPLGTGLADALPESKSRAMLRTLVASGRVVLVGGAPQVDSAIDQLGAQKLRISLDLEVEEDLRRLSTAVGRIRVFPSPGSDLTLAFAGHDFKFLGELTDALRAVDGLQLEYDKWSRQDRNSMVASDAVIDEADVIFCEFASHNAVWYSWHKRPSQRLVVRFHGYELFQDFVHDINMANVDVMVFVSEFYRDRVVAELGWSRDKTAVVHNMIDAFDLDRPKNSDARFHLGIAGIVPILKRPDRALDLLERLIAEDDRYVLHIRGRSPWEYGWMWQNHVSQDAYRAFYERLTENPRLLAHMAFDEFGADMGMWFQRIGWMLSPSSRETFHLAPVEGCAGGAIPVVWQRDGAEEIFGAPWVHGSTEDAAAWILRINSAETDYRAEAQRARSWSRRFDVTAMASRWSEILFPDNGADELPDHGLEDRFDEDALRARYDEQGTPAALDRLILGLLSRSSTADTALTLAEEHPGDLASLSAETLRRLNATRERRALRSAEILRPPRSIGAAYLARPGAALVLGEEVIAAPDVQEDGVPPAEEACLPVRHSDDDEQLLAAGAASRSVLDRIHLAADALTRRARVIRPQVLSVDRGSAVSAWAAVVAARRLGLPVAAYGSAPHEDGPADEEFDALVQGPSMLTEGAVQEIQRRHDERIVISDQKRLDQVTIGIISDEFTERTIAERCTVVHIPRKDAYLTVAAQSMDALFVESAWSGRDGEWFHGVAYYKDSRTDIEQAVRIARARGIPVIFWNKEDPVHFRSFAPTAALCDVVFTTDSDRIPAYLDNDVQWQNRAVASMPFFAEPRLHHPMPGSWPRNRTASYAGTYYGARYADRSAELDRILAEAQPVGLTIYDRQRNHPDSPYAFPDRYSTSIAGGLAYDEVLEAYKAHPVHINVNSVNDSPSMFSRRVVEIAASGSVVVSGKGRGVQESLPEVPVSDAADVLGRIMEECLSDSGRWRRRAWNQLRGVRRSYLGQHALTIMLRAAGLPISCAAAPPWAAVFHGRMDETDARELLRQSHRPTAVVTAERVIEPRVSELLDASGIEHCSEVKTEWAAVWEPGRPVTWAEDLMHAAEFVPEEVTTIGARTPKDGEYGLMSWSEPELPVPFLRWGRPAQRSISWIIDDEQEEGTRDHEH